MRLLHWPAGRSGGIGRRAGLKIRLPSGRVGSIPTFGMEKGWSSPFAPRRHETIGARDVDGIHDPRRGAAHRRPPRRQRAAGSPAARGAGARASTTSAISPTSSRRRTTSPGTSSEGSRRLRRKGRTRWRPTWTTPVACSTRSVGTKRGSLAIRGAGISPCTSRRRCRSACSGRSPSTRSGRWATDAGRSSTRRSSVGRPRRCAARARELDELTTEGAADDELALEEMRLVWPAYFADPERAPPMPELRIASERSAQMGRSILAELPVLEAGLPGIGCLSASSTAHGARCRSPLRRTRRTGFPARGSTWSTVRAISCGSRPRARFAPRFGASPPYDPRLSPSRARPTTGPAPRAGRIDFPEPFRSAEGKGCRREPGVPRRKGWKTGWTACILPYSPQGPERA